VQQFLDEWHYRIISSSLAKQWDRTRTVATALSFFQLSGLPLGENQIAEMTAMEEASMVTRIVSLMDANFMAGFEYLQLQMALVIMTATTIRKSLEENNQEAIWQSMEHTESAGVPQQILKQAIVHACAEAGKIRNTHKTWSKNTESRIARLHRGAEDAERTQQQLQAVLNQLESFGETQNGKSKKVLMGLANNQDRALMNTCYDAWYGFLSRVKSEKSIRDKFEDQITTAERKLFEYKERQLTNIKGVINRGNAAGIEDLLKTIWEGWGAGIREQKLEAEKAAELEAVNARLANVCSSAAENAKKVMGRAAAGNDQGLLLLCVQAWTGWLDEVKKDRELDGQVAESQAKLQEYLKSKNEEAKGVLDRMGAGSEEGLMKMFWSYWVQIWKEEVKNRELEAQMQAMQDRMNGLSGKQKGNAMSVQERVNAQMATNLLLNTFSAWVLGTKQIRVEQYFTSKMESRRKQLSSVQGMFKSFATQLETGLAPDSESGRKGPAQKSDRQSVELSIEQSVPKRTRRSNRRKKKSLDGSGKIELSEFQHYLLEEHARAGAKLQEKEK